MIGVVLHALFGAFLGMILWFVGLGGMESWFAGKKTSWLGGAGGFWCVLLISLSIGAFSYFVRDKKLIDSAPESDAHGRLFWKRALFLIPAAIGIYFIWTFARGR